jgi:hypothetical protein
VVECKCHLFSTKVCQLQKFCKCVIYLFFYSGLVFWIWLPRDGFTFEEFFERFSLRYQNLCINCFNALLDFGIHICGV